MDSGPELSARPKPDGALGATKSARRCGSSAPGATPRPRPIPRPVAGPWGLPVLQALRRSSPSGAYRPVRTSPSGWWALGLDPFRW